MQKGEGHLGQQVLAAPRLCMVPEDSGDLSLKRFWEAVMSSTQSSWSVPESC